MTHTFLIPKKVEGVMRTLLLTVLLVVSLAGCTVPGREPVEDVGSVPLPAEDPGPFRHAMPDPPRGHIELRWPGGEWARSAVHEEITVLNITATKTQLDGPQSRTVEARFVGTLGNLSAWEPRWVSWDWSGRGRTELYSEDPTQVQSFQVVQGRTEIGLEFMTRDREFFERALPAFSFITHAWELRGTVFPGPVQIPGEPAVQHEIRVPTGGRWGTMVLSTAAEGEAPVTGRDLRLSVHFQREELCTSAPPFGFNDHTEHYQQAQIWELLPLVQVFVGNPSDSCGGSFNGPLNQEPIDYVLSIRLVQDGEFGLIDYVH